MQIEERRVCKCLGVGLLSGFQYGPVSIRWGWVCVGKPLLVCTAALRDRSVETLHFLRCSRHQSASLVLYLWLYVCVYFMLKVFLVTYTTYYHIFFPLHHRYFVPHIQQKNRGAYWCCRQEYSETLSVAVLIICSLPLPFSIGLWNNSIQFGLNFDM